MAKWDNMLSILWMLRSGRKLTVAQIADSLEINIRTVYRYIDAFCASGVPVVAESGHDGGIRILESFKETPLFLNSVELKALMDWNGRKVSSKRGACMLIQSSKSTGFLGACRAATAPFAFFADRGVTLNHITSNGEI